MKVPQQRTLAVWIGLYALALALLVVGLCAARRQVIASLDTPAAKAKWQAWKAETQRQAKQGGPVQRRAPKSDEPPLLILLRDYFPGVLGSSVLLVSCLFVFLGLVLPGALRQPAPRDPTHGRD